MIVADTGAIVALLDRSDRHHRDILAMYDDDPTAWVVPWAILPEVDYLIGAHLGVEAGRLFLEDLAERRFEVEWGRDEDHRARGGALGAVSRPSSRSCRCDRHRDRRAPAGPRDCDPRSPRLRRGRHSGIARAVAARSEAAPSPEVRRARLRASAPVEPQKIWLSANAVTWFAGCILCSTWTSASSCDGSCV